MTSSERPSPEPLLKKEASPAVLMGRQSWKCSGGFTRLESEAFRDPSRTLEGNSRKSSQSVSGVFPEFSGISSGKSQPNWGYGPKGIALKVDFPYASLCWPNMYASA